jgi:hypothetical protein
MSLTSEATWCANMIASSAILACVHKCLHCLHRDAYHTALHKISVRATLHNMRFHTVRCVAAISQMYI